MDGLALLSDDRLQWLAVPTPAWFMGPIPNNQSFQRNCNFCDVSMSSCAKLLGESACSRNCGSLQHQKLYVVHVSCRNSPLKRQKCLLRYPKWLWLWLMPYNWPTIHSLCERLLSFDGSTHNPHNSKPDCHNTSRRRQSKVVSCDRLKRESYQSIQQDCCYKLLQQKTRTWN